MRGTQEKWWKENMKLKGYYNLYKDNAKIASVTKFIYKLVIILKKSIILHKFKQLLKTNKPDNREPVPQISVNCLRVSSQPPMQPDYMYAWISMIDQLKHNTLPRKNAWCKGVTLRMFVCTSIYMLEFWAMCLHRSENNKLIWWVNGNHRKKNKEWLLFKS